MRRFILGTDWWDDCDDAVALRLLTRAVRADKLRLLGVGINACMSDSVASLCGFLRADGLIDIPVGIDTAATDFGGTPPYQRHLAADFAPDLCNGDGEDAVRLYRRLLQEAEPGVEILEIGFLQVIAGVLTSGADDISEKSGLELVREKVAKVWVMGGKWDTDGGVENNFARNARARRAAHTFCALCPVPVTFLGFEIGVGMITGRSLSHSDHLFRVLSDHGSANGRDSWDPMLAMLALTGDEAAAGYTAVRGQASVDAETGENHFTPDADGKQAYVVATPTAREAIARLIEAEL